MKELGLIAFGALLTATPALAEGWDFMLVNNTKQVITKLEVAATGTSTWAANNFDSEIKKDPNIKVGGKTTVHFDKGSSCKYDVRATFDDKSANIWTGFNVCDNSYITISITGGKPTFKAS